MSKSRVAFAGVAILAIAALLTWLVWIVLVPTEPRPQEQALVGSSANHPMDVVGASQVAPPERELVADDGVVVRVISSLRRPILGAAVMPRLLSSVPNYVDCLPAAGAITNADGMATLSLASDEATVTVVAESFLPGCVHNVLRGKAYEVALEPVLLTTIRVRDRGGKAIAGFGVSVPIGEVGRNEHERAAGASADGRFCFTNSGIVSRALTDINGVATLLIPGGEFRPRWNTTGLRLTIVNGRDLRRLCGGQSYDVVVSEPIACVVQLRGDVILGSRLAPGRSAAFAGDHDNALARSRAKAELERRFPDCIVGCEVDSGGDGAAASLYVIGRESGITKHAVQYRPLSEWAQPLVLDLPRTGLSMSATVRVDVANPDGTSVRLGPGDLMMRVKHGASWISTDLPGSGEVELPSGEVEIVPGASGIPSNIFQAVTLRVEPGRPQSLELKLIRAIYRGCLQFRRRDGDAPLWGSVDYGMPDSLRTRLMSVSADITGWFEIGAVYDARFGVEHAAGSVMLNTQSDPNVVQEWKVEVAK